MMRVSYVVLYLTTILLPVCHVTSAMSWQRLSLSNPAERKCQAYMHTCVPWKEGCCGGLSCVNLRKGYCVYPLEMCVCQMRNSYNVDQDVVMYS